MYVFLTKSHCRKLFAQKAWLTHDRLRLWFTKFAADFQHITFPLESLDLEINSAYRNTSVFIKNMMQENSSIWNGPQIG